jgi:hypothetical protein
MYAVIDGVNDIVINRVNDREEDSVLDWVLDSDIGKKISIISNNDLDMVDEGVFDLLIKGGNNWVVRDAPRPFEPCQELLLTT